MALSLDGTTGITSDGGTPVIENLDTTATGIAVTGQLTVEAGAVSQAAQTTDIAVFKNDANGYIKLYGPNTSTGGIAFGDSDDPYVGALTYSHSSDAMTMYVNNSERMRIDSAGNVGIGTSSPATTWDTRAANRVVSSQYGIANIYSTDTYAIDKGGSLSFGGRYASDGSSQTFGSIAGRKQDSGDGSWGGYLQFNTGTTLVERARIDTSGNLLVGTTASLYSIPNGVAASGSSIGVVVVGHASGVTSGNGFINFNYNSGAIGSITQNGTTGVSYNTSSDYRLKEDWVAVANASTRVNALKPVNFAWKADGSRVDGFLAHELAEVVPEAVTGAKDAMRDEEYEITPRVLATYDEEGNELTPAVEVVMGTRSVPDYQGIDQSKLVPLLTAALQEALAAIDDLTARVSALEAK